MSEMSDCGFYVTNPTPWVADEYTGMFKVQAVESSPVRTREVFSDYLRCVFTPAELKLRVEWAARILRGMADSDGVLPAVCFRGTSGAALAWALAYETGCDVVRVGKKEERRHGSYVEGVYATKGTLRLVWVDDFIATGKTLYEVMRGVEFYQGNMSYGGKGTKVSLEGILLYHDTAVPEENIVRAVLEEFPNSTADNVFVITHARGREHVHVGKTPGDMYDDEQKRLDKAGDYMPDRPYWLSECETEEDEDNDEE